MTFDDLHIGSILVSTVRNAPVLIFAGMAGLFAERSGVIDIGLEGKILASAFVSAAVAFTTVSSAREPLRRWSASTAKVMSFVMLAGGLDSPSWSSNNTPFLLLKSMP